MAYFAYFSEKRISPIYFGVHICWVLSTLALSMSKLISPKFCCAMNKSSPTLLQYTYRFRTIYFLYAFGRFEVSKINIKVSTVSNRIDVYSKAEECIRIVTLSVALQRTWNSANCPLNFILILIIIRPMYSALISMPSFCSSPA